MNKSWLESPYLWWQLRLDLLSLPVSSSLNISPNGFDELEGRIYILNPPQKRKNPRAIQDDMGGWAAETCTGEKRRRRIERAAFDKRVRGVNPSVGLLLLSRRWSSDSPHAPTSSTGALQKCRKMYISSNRYLPVFKQLVNRFKIQLFIYLLHQRN